ncbi:MAG: hypothetical protein HZB99_00410 [Candidatus Harrisonbacteria bacterium]|nr:hypothetical protein [Candidatus Harrisonbacteria bacterium]
MKNLYRVLVLMCIALCLSTIYTVTRQEMKRISRISEEKVENIVRVLMHDRYNWTLITEKNDSKELKMEAYRCNDYSDCVHLFKDVSGEEKMWSHVVMRDNGINARWRVISLEIHLHSEKNVEGAGWDHGKTGKGMTQVIE